MTQAKKQVVGRAGAPMPATWLAFDADTHERAWVRNEIASVKGAPRIVVLASIHAVQSKLSSSAPGSVGVLLGIDDDLDALLGPVRRWSQGGHIVVALTRRPSHSPAPERAVAHGVQYVVSLPEHGREGAGALFLRRLQQAFRQAPRKAARVAVDVAPRERRTPRVAAATPALGVVSRAEPAAAANVSEGDRPAMAGPQLAVLGISTGGPTALEQVMPRFNAQSPPLVIVQHMPASFTRELAERLDGMTKARVLEASDGALLRPGAIYVAPGGRHTVIRRGRQGLQLAITDAPPVGGHRPSVDVLFRSVVELGMQQVVAAIMTGIGDDGVNALAALRAMGVRTLAQRGVDCAVFGMPRQAIERGAAQFVVPLVEMGDALHGR